MENDRGRSISPSRSSVKRKTDIRDDYEQPPRKSPAGTPIPSPGHSPIGSPSHSPCRSPVGSPSPLIYNCDDHSPSLSRQGSFKRKTIRASRGVLRRQSTGDVTWPTEHRSISPGSSFECDGDTPSFASLAQQHRDDNPEEEDEEDTFGDIPSFRNNPSFQSYRPGSKDLLDDYISRKKDARRRSSCKEITFQLFRQDTGDMTDPDEPRFRLLERQRRLTIANKLMESISDSSENLLAFPANPLAATLTADNIPTDDDFDLDSSNKSPSLRLRSRSAEGYDPSQVKDTRQETRAMMFDSVPDIKDEEERVKFQTIRRNKRRGAVCYDTDNALSLLEKLNISDLNISSMEDEDEDVHLEDVTLPE